MRPAVSTLFFAFVLGGCGGPSLAALRCESTCQDVQNPFLLRLLVDYEDPDRVLPTGHLVASIDGSEQDAMALASLMPASPPPSGTFAFPLPLHFSTLQDGRRFTVSVHAVSGDEETNATSLDLVLGL